MQVLQCAGSAVCAAVALGIISLVLTRGMFNDGFTSSGTQTVNGDVEGLCNEI